MTRKLYRSRTDSMVAGICGGIAEYFNIDSSLVRVGAVLFTFAGGAGVIAYIVFWLVVPQAPLEQSLKENQESPSEAIKGSGEKEEERDSGVLMVGGILIVLGILLLLNNYLPFSWLSFSRLWPLLVVFLGVIILMKGASRKNDES